MYRIIRFDSNRDTGGQTEIVVQAVLDGLEKRVGEMIAQGWVAAGGIQYLIRPRNSGYHHFAMQAMAPSAELAAKIRSEEAERRRLEAEKLAALERELPAFTSTEIEP